MFLILSLFLLNSSIASPPQNLKDVYEEDSLSFEEEEEDEKETNSEEAEEDDWRSNSPTPSPDDDNFEDD